MNVQELICMFTEVRKHTPEHVNELLDFAKRSYVQNEISFNDYRILMRELELQGAVTPEDLQLLS